MITSVKGVTDEAQLLPNYYFLSEPFREPLFQPSKSSNRNLNQEFKHKEMDQIN